MQRAVVSQARTIDLKRVAEFCPLATIATVTKTMLFQCQKPDRDKNVSELLATA